MAFDPIILMRVVDADGRQVGFVDPSTGREVLEEGRGLVRVMLDWDSPAPPARREEVELEARRSLSILGAASREKLAEEVEQLFGRRWSVGRIKINVLASLLVLKGGRAKLEPPRKLVVFHPSELGEEGGELVTNMSREEIPGVTPRLHWVRATTFVGQALPWIVMETGTGRYNVHATTFNFACGSQTVKVTAKMVAHIRAGENLQLYPNIRNPEHIYSTDRGMVWWRRTIMGKKPVSFLAQPSPHEHTLE